MNACLCLSVSYQGPIYAHGDGPAPIPPQGMLVQPEMHLPHPGQCPLRFELRLSVFVYELLTSPTPPQVSTPTSQAVQSLTPPCTEAHLFLCRQGNHSSCCHHHLSTPRLES